jgi:hypothetical protein
MTARLPVIGSDNNNWGTILNSYLQVSLDTDGSLLTSAVATAGAPTFVAIPAISVRTSNYTMNTGKSEVVLTDATTSAVIITLPTAIGNSNIFTVKKTDGSSHTVTVATTLFQTIDGGSTAVLKVQYAAVSLVSDGSNWLVI